MVAGAGLGEAVPLEDHQPGRLEPPGDLGRERRAARAEVADPAAHARLDLAEDQPVGDGVLGLEQRRRARARRAAPRPPCRRRRTPSGRSSGFAPPSSSASATTRPYTFSKIRGTPAMNVGRTSPRLSTILSTRPSTAVAKPTWHWIASSIFPNECASGSHRYCTSSGPQDAERVDGGALVEPVGVGELHALGAPGRARGVDQRGQVVRLRRGDRVGRPQSGARPGTAAPRSSSAAERHDPVAVGLGRAGRRRRSPSHGAELVPVRAQLRDLRLVLGDDEPRLRVGHDEARRPRRSVARVDRRHRAARAHHREVGEHPLDPGRAGDRDPVLGLQPERQQPGRPAGSPGRRSRAQLRRRPAGPGRVAERLAVGVAATRSRNSRPNEVAAGSTVVTVVPDGSRSSRPHDHRVLAIDVRCDGSGRPVSGQVRLRRCRQTWSASRSTSGGCRSSPWSSSRCRRAGSANRGWNDLADRDPVRRPLDDLQRRLPPPPSPWPSTRRYAPGAPCSVNRRTQCGSSIQRLERHARDARRRHLRARTARRRRRRLEPPSARRSRAPVTSTPPVVRFSPNVPGGSGRPSSRDQSPQVLARVGVHRLVAAAVVPAVEHRVADRGRAASTATGRAGGALVDGRTADSPSGSATIAWTMLTDRTPERGPGDPRAPALHRYSVVDTRCPKTIMRCEEFQRGLQVVSVMSACVGVAFGLPGTGWITHTSRGQHDRPVRVVVDHVRVDRGLRSRRRPCRRRAARRRSANGWPCVAPVPGDREVADLPRQRGLLVVARRPRRARRARCPCPGLDRPASDQLLPEPRDPHDGERLAGLTVHGRPGRPSGAAPPVCGRSLAHCWRRSSVSDAAAASARTFVHASR